MAAIDYVQDRNIKKLKFHDMVWQVTSGSLAMGTDQSLIAVVGPVDWDRSRYLKVGKEMCYYAFVGEKYYVLLDKMRVGYVEPKHYSRMPLYDASQDDSE